MARYRISAGGPGFVVGVPGSFDGGTLVEHDEATNSVRVLDQSDVEPAPADEVLPTNPDGAAAGDESPGTESASAADAVAIVDVTPAVAEIAPTRARPRRRVTA